MKKYRKRRPRYTQSVVADRSFIATFPVPAQRSEPHASKEHRTGEHVEGILPDAAFCAGIEFPFRSCYLRVIISINPKGPDMTSYIPEGWGTMSPYLVMKNASAAIDFYLAAFDAQLLSRMDMPGGGVGHAELQIGDSKFMLADEVPDQGYLGPESIGGSPVSFMLYVRDVDAVFARAVAAGASVLRPVADQFYGDRVGSLKDPTGHIWSIATHIEDVAPEEIDRRFTEMMSGGAEKAE